MPLRPKDFLSMGRLAARCADDKKARDIALLDMRRVSGVADYFLLISVESLPQLKASADAIEDAVQMDFSAGPAHREGLNSPQWTVLDYGGLVIHLFHHEARHFYGLERLWENARAVTWEDLGVPAKKKPAPRARRRKK